MTSLRALLFSALLVAGCGDDGGGTPGDVAPPTTPEDLTARLVEADTVDLTWSPSIDDVAVTGYRVFRDGDSLDTTPGAAYTDGDAPLQAICYTVSAFDAAGNESAQSDPACLDVTRSWILRAAGVPTTLEAIAWSGTTFAAVGANGLETQKFLISSDAVHWLPQHHEQFAGASVIASNGQEFVALTDLGVYASPDGRSGRIVAEDPWPALDVGADLTWSGAEFIAVGPGGRIFATTDALTWTERTSPTSEDLAAILSSGGQLVAAGGAGTILTSPDGVTWTAQPSGTIDPLERVASRGAQLLVLGQTELVASTDGAAWTPATYPPGAPTAIAGSPELGLFAVVGRNGLIATSTDGAAWTPRAVATAHAFFDVIWGQGRFVAVGEQGTVATSVDGATWAVQTSGDFFLDVAWLGDRLVAVGNGGKVSVSPDGIEWTHGWTGAGSHVNQDIAWSGSRYVIGSYMSLLSSTDLETWTAHDIGAQECRGVVWTGSLFAAACTGSAVRLSPNGTDWTVHFVDGTFATDVNDVAWTGGQLVVVGEGGLIATSPDGAAWTARASGTTGRLRGVAWSGAHLVAVGEAGTIVTSTDGVSWSPVTTAVTETFYDVSWLGDRFAAVGGNRSILVSADGLTWEDRSVEDSYPRLNGVSAVNGKIVIVAEDGHVLMSP